MATSGPATTTSSDEWLSLRCESGATQIGPFAARHIELGDPDGSLVLLLHGVYAGASKFEWRSLAPLLARDHRVRIPDLLGTGSSDRPDLEWTADRLTTVVAALIEDASAAEAVTVVASSLTAAHAVRAVANDGLAVESLRLITPTGLGTEHQRPGRLARSVYAAGRHTPLGDALIRVLSSGPSIAWFQRNKTYSQPDALTDDEIDETRRVARLPNAKHLQLAFVTNALWVSLSDAEVQAAQPSVLWGGGQAFTSEQEAER